MSDKNKNITAKNLAENPDKGGIPARETRLINKTNVTKLPVLKTFKSLKFLIFFKSNKKKIKKTVLSTIK